jgi:hypothetical protein
MSFVILAFVLAVIGAAAILYGIKADEPEPIWLGLGGMIAATSIVCLAVWQSVISTP